MLDIERIVAEERYQDYQREAQRAQEMYNAVHGAGNVAGSRGGWRNRRQRLGHSLVRAGAVIAGDSDRAAR